MSDQKQPFVISAFLPDQPAVPFMVHFEKCYREATSTMTGRADKRGLTHFICYSKATDKACNICTAIGYYGCACIGKSVKQDAPTVSCDIVDIKKLTLVRWALISGIILIRLGKNGYILNLAQEIQGQASRQLHTGELLRWLDVRHCQWPDFG